MFVFVPYPFVDAFYTGTNDEHTILHVPKYREDGALGAKKEPNIATQEHLPLCIDQDCGHASVSTARYSVGCFHFA